MQALLQDELADRPGSAGDTAQRWQQDHGVDHTLDSALQAWRN